MTHDELPATQGGAAPGPVRSSTASAGSSTGPAGSSTGPAGSSTGPAGSAAAPAAAPSGPGAEPGSRSVTKLTDPRALRALAHPIRLALVGMLRQEGPLTATRAAALLGESSASASFHLRQLAKYGLVEEAGGGRGRERPWRATAMFTQWPDVAEGAEQQAATALLSSVIAERYFEDLMRWLSAKPEESPEWQEAAHFGDTFVYATAAELRELARQEVALLEPFLQRQLRPELRPPGARPISYLHLAFPREITPAEPAPGGPAAP